MGWLLLLPLFFAFWLAIKIANECARRERGYWRLLGLLSSLAIGGVCILVGYWFGIEGSTEWNAQANQDVIVTYPVLGWIAMIGGGLIAISGTWTALAGTKKEIELREKAEWLEEGRKLQEQKWAKAEAKKLLEQRKIDDFPQAIRIFNILDKAGLDWGAIMLKQDLKSLMKKQTERRIPQEENKTTLRQTVVCPKCKKRNIISSPADSTKMYRCGSCGAQLEKPLGM